jgi:tRNA (cytidine/uridine-2'-O-)-methyltransferase
MNCPGTGAGDPLPAPLLPNQPQGLPPHRLKVALVHPQIAPNTGNIARLCVATGTELHLVRPLGFVLSDRNLRRSAMDYWSRLNYVLHDDLAAFSRSAGDTARMWMFDSVGETHLWDADFGDGDWLVFGSETRGLPAELMSREPGFSVRIPQVAGERCLNLATSAGIALFEGFAQRNDFSRFCCAGGGSVVQKPGCLD